MADNITLPGTGKIVSADDVGAGVLVQHVKLMDGTDGSSALIPGSVADGLLVNVGNIPKLADCLAERAVDATGAPTALTTFGATAAKRNYITAITVTNTSGTTGYVDLRDGVGGAAFWTIPLPANGGAHIEFPTPLPQPTINTALAFDVSAAIATIILSFAGFKR